MTMSQKIFGHSTDMPTCKNVIIILILQAGISVLDQGGIRSSAEFDCIRRDPRVPADNSFNCTQFLDAQTDDDITYGFLYPPGLSLGTNRQMDAYISSNVVPMYRGFKHGNYSGF